MRLSSLLAIRMMACCFFMRWDKSWKLTRRTGSLRTATQVPLPRPRTMEVRSDPRFIELEKVIWKQIEEEVNATGGFAQL